MSTPEHPATPALTRKQIRELRNTGSTPVITATPADGAIDAPAAPVSAVPVDAALSTPPPAPFPRPSEPAAVAPAPVPDSAVDLGVSPLTRRQARQQERIRTASVPVITPEVVAAHAAATGGSAPAFAFPVAPPPVAPVDDPAPSLFTPAQDDAQVSTDSGMHALFGIPRDTETSPAPTPASSWQQAATAAPVSVPAFAAEPAASDVDDRALDDVFGASAAEPEASPAAPKAVSPLLGASLLDEEPAAGQPAAVEFPPSFDQLLTRTTGAIAIPNALIVSQAPEVAPLVAPVTATGEVIVTGTFNLPEGLGSTGHAKGTADGKEIDATLVDGELPSHSSPTPIAASSAVSTVKAPGDVIKPPVPEKGGKLMMSLAITAGVLALALVGVLILAFVTGVF
ncbi:hypothetical protein JNB63_01605 [Microbacterium trichothecenolyticum]|uniref:hypothetical protein n=1 Tax=Microbacterium trichothecenolyticum TaxID=69370 RepID=UPI001C6E0749|nr:hypothetical protein [Microbacterium trichothecenolyticum]MBW9118783.1 hypothetical protein [Microbacterium trichothecenolyticum]